MSLRPVRQPTLLLFLSLFLLLAVSPAAARETAPPLTGVVTWIYDADTLEVDPHGKVRLLGIDAPERTASERDRAFTRLGVDPARLRAVHGAGIAHGIQHLKGQTVTLICDTPRRDRYGRLLAYLYLADGRLYNRQLLEDGLVIVYRRFDFRLKADFLAAETQARQRGSGLWSR